MVNDSQSKLKQAVRTIALMVQSHRPEFQKQTD